MAILPLSNYQSPRYPEGPMTIAAIAQLMSSVLGGVEDWKRRKMDDERYREQVRQRESLMDFEREKYATEQERLTSPVEIPWEKGVGPTPEGGTVTHTREIPAWQASLPHIKAQVEDVLGSDDDAHARYVQALQMQHAADALAETIRHNKAMEGLQGGGGGDDYLDLSRFLGAAGDLPEDIDRTLKELDPTNKEAIAELGEQIDELKMLAPHPEALDALERRFADEAKTTDDVIRIWGEFQALPGIDRGDLIAARKLYDLAKLTKPGPWDVGPQLPPAWSYWTAGMVPPDEAGALDDAMNWQMRQRAALGAYGRMF